MYRLHETSHGSRLIFAATSILGTLWDNPGYLSKLLQPSHAWFIYNCSADLASG